LNRPSGSTSQPELVLDSFEFGREGDETQVANTVEMDLVAQQFAKLDPTIEIPSAPVVSC